MNNKDDRPEMAALFTQLKARLPQLETLLGKTGPAEYEDFVYRFYHQSFKVYLLQDRTTAIVAALQSLAPDRKLNDWFMQIVRDGTGKIFTPAHNANWPEVTRPIVEAFFHARFFLEVAVRYGRELEYPPTRLPDGWAAFLYLYDLR
jgi:hypothetical protein